MNPLISVIIPTYNCGKYIREALEGVFNQTYKNYEVLVIDDGSTDNTKEVLKEYEQKIKYFYQENKGLSITRNRGIKEAQGELIALLDSDDIWLPEKLELQTDLILKNDKTGMVFCGCYMVDEIGKIIRKMPQKKYSCKSKFFDALLITNIVIGSGATPLVRRQCFEKIGLFDEKLKSAEDWDMWLRILRFYDIKSIELPLAKVRMRPDSISAPSNAGLMLENELKVCNKNFSDAMLKKKIFLKNRSYSMRYFRAAYSYSVAGQIDKSKYYLFKSFFLFPFDFFSKSHLVLFLRVLLGKKTPL